MHLTSLPSPFGVGTMGAAARRFLEFLEAAGQTYWQLLPICPTSFGDSPYQSFSTFAGNPYLIDLDDLAADGLLRAEEYVPLDWGAQALAVDYGLLYQRRYPVLRKACARLLAAPPAEFAVFCKNNSFWLEDYALFMALKGAHGGAAWQDWEAPLRNREPLALERARRALGEDISFWKGVQFLFFRQWRALKDCAGRRGVRIIGDLPIYVSGDSVDVWAHPEQFQLDGDRLPHEVAGVPPDGFSADGQLWGNPLFDWDAMRADGYTWWKERIARAFRLYDILRIDHFRGFDRYYAVPYGENSAKRGTWRQGPGAAFFDGLKEYSIVAEDLGIIDEGVRQLLAETGYPGMKVLSFAFDGNPDNPYLPSRFGENAAVYTGTHDNPPVKAWLMGQSREERSRLTAILKRECRALSLPMRAETPDSLTDKLIEVAFASRAALAVIPYCDLLKLGEEGRINAPSTLSDRNWSYRCLKSDFTGALQRRLSSLAMRFGRG